MKTCRIDGRAEAAFTLIELLTIIGIIGVLASLALVNYSLYKTKAARAVVMQTRHDAQVALEAGTADPATAPSSAGSWQTTPGLITDAQGRLLLPGFILPQRSLIRYTYDHDCVDATCIESMIGVVACTYKVYATWVRFGDGVEAATEGILAAAPC